MEQATIGNGWTPLVKVLFVREKAERTQTIKRPADVQKAIALFNILGEGDAESTTEKAIALYLDVRKRIVAVRVVSEGTLDASIVHPREVFQAAVHFGVSSVIFAHNHPSGDLAPSEDDMTLTRRLVLAGELLGIDLVDSVIIAGDKMLSMKEKGFM